MASKSDTREFKVGSGETVQVWRAYREDGHITPVLQAVAGFTSPAMERLLANQNWKYWGFSFETKGGITIEGFFAFSGPLYAVVVNFVIPEENIEELVSSIIGVDGYVLIRGAGKGRMAEAFYNDAMRAGVFDGKR